MESFVSSGKQGSGAAVLREGRDIVTRDVWVPTSLNVNNLRKSSHAAFCTSLSSEAGAHQTHPANHWAQLCLCQVLIGFS
jgi:hypothetical protein